MGLDVKRLILLSNYIYLAPQFAFLISSLSLTRVFYILSNISYYSLIFLSWDFAAFLPNYLAFLLIIYISF
jgi:hypothetical protein